MGSVKIGDAVKFHRLKRGLSQRAAATELGISYVYLNRVEKYKVSPTLTMLEVINSKWGIDVYLTALSLSDNLPGWMRPIVDTVNEHDRG